MTVQTENSLSRSRWHVTLQHVRKETPTALMSGIGGALAIWLLAQAAALSHLALLAAPFGASCVLLFALPQSPLAQPRNVIGGHVLSTLVGLLVLTFVGQGPLACGLGVGLAIFVMQISATMHPPAGGDPIVVILTGATWTFLGFPILVGTVLLVIAAWCFHRFISRRRYPS